LQHVTNNENKKCVDKALKKAKTITGKRQLSWQTLRSLHSKKKTAILWQHGLCHVQVFQHQANTRPALHSRHE